MAVKRRPVQVPFARASEEAAAGQELAPALDAVFSDRQANPLRDPPALPGFRLHPLKGELKGLWAVTVRANWRVVFRFEEGKALDVDYVDYH